MNQGTELKNPTPAEVTIPLPQELSSDTQDSKDSKKEDLQKDIDKSPSLAEKKRYAIITDEQRKNLLLGVLTQGRHMKDVCQEVGVNLSTAQGIIKTFLNEGRIGKKKKRTRWNPFTQTMATALNVRPPVAPNPMPIPQIPKIAQPILPPPSLHNPPLLMPINYQSVTPRLDMLFPPRPALPQLPNFITNFCNPPQTQTFAASHIGLIQQLGIPQKRQNTDMGPFTALMAPLTIKIEK